MEINARLFRSGSTPNTRVFDVGYNGDGRDEISWTRPLSKINNYDVFRRIINQVNNSNNFQRTLYLWIESSQKGGIGFMYSRVNQVFQDLFLIPRKLDETSLPTAVFRMNHLDYAVPFPQPAGMSQARLVCQCLKFTFENCSLENW